MYSDNLKKTWKEKKTKLKKLQLNKPKSLKKKLSNQSQKMTMSQYRLLKTSQSRQSKYNNIKTSYNGHSFDSKKEANRAKELDILVRVGEVTSWSPQPEFRIEHKGVLICKYRADFAVRYLDGRIEYEDVKGVRTAVYKLKKKLVKAFHNVDIKEL